MMHSGWGVLQNRALLDYEIDRFLTGRKRIPPVLRDILPLLRNSKKGRRQLPAALFRLFPERL